MILLDIFHRDKLNYTRTTVIITMLETLSTTVRTRIETAESFPYELQTEIIRKSIHLLIAFVPFFASVDIVFTMTLLGGGIIFYSISEMLRYEGKQVLIISYLTAIAARKRDRGKFILGPVTLGLGAMLALLFYPEPAASLAIYALAFGDGFSSVFGKMWGKRVIPLTGGKTYVGSITCFLTVFIVSFRIIQNIPIAFSLALITMLLEAVPTGDMDNILIPAGTGFLAYRLLM